jgi:hypothetical protein
MSFYKNDVLQRDKSGFFPKKSFWFLRVENLFGGCELWREIFGIRQTVRFAAPE